jgi:DNA polymerase-3 subunit chi
MTERVDFYVLKSAAARQRWAFACRLVEKAYLRDLRIVVASDTGEDAKAIDDLLWTFNDRSFVPHRVCADERALDPATPVHISSLPLKVPAADLLVNLSSQLPAHWDAFGRVAEIIDADPECRRLGRERFKTYRDLKVTLETHQLDESADV